MNLRSLNRAALAGTAMLAGLLPIGAASADSGTAVLRLHLQSGSQYTSGASPGAPLPLPEGVLELDVLNAENEPEPWVTAEAIVAPCAGPAPTGPVDVVVRRGLIGSATLIVPADSCLFSNRTVRVTVWTVASLSTDTADPVYVDIPDVALADVPVPFLGAPDRPTPPYEVTIDTSAAVPSSALYDVLVLGSANGVNITGAGSGCVGTSPAGIGVGGARRGVAIVPHNACAILYVEGADSALQVTVAGYLAPPPATGSATWTFPHFRFQGTVAPEFVPASPTRLFDTRATGDPLAAGGVHRLDLRGLDRAVSAVVLNVTVTEPLGSGYVSVYPCDVPPPTVSSINMVAGQTVANQVTVGLLPSRQLCFLASTRTHLLADLSGTYELGRGDGFEPVTPVRLFDTRDAGSALTDGSVFHLDLTGRVPDDASAVSVNTTIVGSITPGFVTVWPCNEDRPLASNLNFDAGETRANLVTVKVGAAHDVCFYVHGRTHLLADLSGWYAPSVTRGFIDSVPFRVFDTREESRNGQLGGTESRVQWNRWVEVVVLNVTVTEPSTAGFVTVHTCGTERPIASNVNYVAGQTVANAVVASSRSAGYAGGSYSCFYAHRTTHLVVDAVGYFSSTKDYVYDVIEVP